jgi:hypothetical protein
VILTNTSFEGVSGGFPAAVKAAIYRSLADAPLRREA